MQTRRLPGTELDLSVIGFGCWPAGGTYWGDDVRDEDSVAAMRRAVELGINWFDTAPLYGYGHADEVLRKALGKRITEVIVATKVGVRFHGADGHAESDLTPEHIREDTEASLKRLGVERLDLTQVHWPCQKGTPLAESIGALRELQGEGKIRYFGLCNYNVQGMTEALEACGDGPRIASLQTPYSMIRRELESELLPWCREHGVGIVVYETLCRGLLSGKYTEPHDFPESDQRMWDERFKGALFARNARFVGQLKRIAAHLKVPVPTLPIAWALGKPGVTAAIVGAKRPAQVEQNVRAASLLRKRGALAVLDKATALF